MNPLLGHYRMYKLVNSLSLVISKTYCPDYTVRRWSGWDFVGESENGKEDIWWLLEGQDYPRLWWEKVSD